MLIKLDRANYLNFAKAGLIVAATMGLVFFVALRLPGIPESVAEILGALLIIPGMVVFLPFMHNIHNFWEGYALLGGVVNWILYTSWVWWILENRRRKRESSRTKPTGRGVPPDEISSSQ
jgi:hypothetical protein